MQRAVLDFTRQRPQGCVRVVDTIIRHRAFLGRPPCFEADGGCFCQVGSREG
jgi:hypothetical protein